MPTPTSLTQTHIRKLLEGESTGHDYWHIHRVFQNARHILQSEPQADTLVVELAALLHDIADHKFHDGDDTIGPRMVREWLESIQVGESTIDHVVDIISTMSFSKGKQMKTLEGQIVQDADRLDALGAIGIARTFAYGGHAGREIYNPDIPPQDFKTKEEYKKANSPSINHFHEKLLLLKDMMNTDSAKKIAQARHDYMLQYLNQFHAEWDGKI